MRPFRALEAFSTRLERNDTGEPLFGPSAVKWIVKADEILAGVGFAFFAFVWFTIMLKLTIMLGHAH